jgi:hypothetical protein
MNHPTNQPGNQQTIEPANQQTNRPTDRPTNNQATNERTNERIPHPPNQPTNEPSNQPTNLATNKPWNQQTNKPCNQQTNKPTDRPANSWSRDLENLIILHQLSKNTLLEPLVFTRALHIPVLSEIKPFHALPFRSFKIRVLLTSDVRPSGPAVPYTHTHTQHRFKITLPNTDQAHDKISANHHE